jgi:dimeric dUTPase (all-alpha-NTP-PPase superfamily)
MMKKKLKTMLDMQNALNIHTNGEFWATNHKNEKTGKVINWRRAIWLELAEFVESFDWKHWKHAKNDLDNAKTELVDIWHFMLSETITQYPKNTTEELAALLSGHMYKKVNLNKELELSEMLVSIVLDKNKPFTFSVFDNEPNAYSVFYTLCDLLKLTFDELFTRYMVKNTLNEFRQNNGYNDGSYIKIWNGKEDNVVALEVADKLGDKLDKESLMSGLTSEYAKLK